MQGVLAGFATIGAIIALGFLLAHFGVLRSDSQLLLTRLVFFVATPALLFQTLSTTTTGQFLSSGLAVAALSFVGTAAVYVLLARAVWRHSTGDLVLGALSSAYVNAGNLGLAGMAVPGVCLAYGVSLRLGPRPIADGSSAELAVVCMLKLLAQPLLAYVAARWLFDLHGRALLAATVVAALPTAQNIFVYATRYGRSMTLARDSIFVTTVLSVPVLLTITALLA